MAGAYDPALRRLALALAPKELRARSGVYVGVGGPSYETPAECRYLRRAGADAVGEEGARGARGVLKEETRKGPNPALNRRECRPKTASNQPKTAPNP
ncbi:purine nucleoside phosphorylase 1-like, partial [Pyrgilauda ruficollis]|uniref:purine nucleoside phosphorylase 1-like n=1 Tax=Pyrgilauda ruficollis TaxID=221976 RepID=UPI001B85EC3E